MDFVGVGGTADCVSLDLQPTFGVGAIFDGDWKLPRLVTFNSSRSQYFE